MAQHDYVIANASGAAVRSDLNNALAAIVSQNSGTTEPATTYAYQRWIDTANGLEKIRNGANNAWITLRTLDNKVYVGAGSAGSPSIVFSGVGEVGSDTGIYSTGDGYVNISTNGNLRFSVDPNGIGVNGTFTSVSNTAACASYTGPINSYWSYSDGTGIFSIKFTSNAPCIGSENNYPLLFLTNNTEQGRITTAGYWGLGTSTPGSRLDVRFATNPLTDNGSGFDALRVWTTSALAANAGGAISFGGTSTSALTQSAFAQVAGRKENATSDNYAGYLQFAVNTAVGTMVEQARIDSAGVLKFNSGFGSVANVYGCRAWANIFAGTTPSIRASGNISSVTDSGAGVGDFTVSFTSAMPDANYAAIITAGGAGTLASSNAVVGWAGIYATGSVRIGISDNNTDTSVDVDYLNVAIFR